jgi:P27 family predicted phage terminase small subunit
MGKRGPSHTDPTLLRLRGTWRGDRHAHLVPPVRAPGELDTLPPPAWFSADMCRIWRNLLDAMPRRLLGRIDYSLLVVLVEAIDRHDRAAAALREMEAAPPTEATAAIVTGLIKRTRQAGSDMRATAQALGITPAARARTSLPSRPEPTDPFRKFVVVEPDAA